MESKPLPDPNAVDWDVLCNPVSVFDGVGTSDKVSDVTILENSLNLIDEILDGGSEEAQAKADEPAVSPPQQSVIVKVLSNHINHAVATILLIGFIAAGVAIKTSQGRGCGGEDEPQCEYTKAVGLPLWKWALFIGLRGPIYVLAHVLVAAVSGIVSSMFLMSGNVVVFLLALKKQVSALVVEVGWLVLWLVFTQSDYDDAKRSNDFFEDVYVAVWKFIVLMAIWRAMAVLRHAFKRWLSLKFYHRAHYKDMMNALVQEHILTQLTKPSVTAPKSSKVQGWTTAHFLALRFITHVLRGHRFQKLLDEAALLALTTRLQTTRAKLIKTINRKINDKRAAGLKVEAEEMQARLDEAIADTTVPDINLVRIAMSRQVGMKWRARAAHKPLEETAAPLLTPDVQEAAFKGLLKRTHRRKDQNSKAETPGRSFSSWVSLGSLASPDADMLKNATRLSWIEDQIRHKTLQVSYLGDEQGSDHKTSLRKFKGDKDEETKEIDTVAEARKLGYFLFWHLKADMDTLEVTAQDIEKVIPANSSQSKIAWKILDKDGNGAVSLGELVDRVVEIYKKRKNLAATLLDTETVVQQCFTAIRVVCDIIWIFIAISIYDPSKFASTWAAISATLLSFSFVFGNSIKVLWENAIYLFTFHPFSVGDLIKIGTVGTSVQGDTYTVNKITLNHLKVTRVGNATFVMPLEQLRTQAIHNVTRSGERWDSFTVYVDMDTSLESLKPVALAVKDYISANPKYFGGLYRVFFTQATISHKLEMSIGFNYCQNGTDLYAMAVGKSGLFNAIAKAMTAAGVEFTIPHQKKLIGSVSDAGDLPSRVDFATTGGMPDTTSGPAGTMGSAGNALMLAAGGVAALNAV